MSKGYVEIDFFQMEKQKNASSKPCSPERPPSSFRGIQNVVSRINPQLLKAVMAAGQTRTSSDNAGAWPTSSSSSSNPPSPSRTASTPPPLPVLFNSSPAADMAPLTIFYNGTVTTVDVPRDKAEALMRMAEAGAVGFPAKTPEDSMFDDDQLEGDLPIARRKSLQRFLEKRKERLTSAFPYHKAISSRPC